MGGGWLGAGGVVAGGSRRRRALVPALTRPAPDPDPPRLARLKELCGAHPKWRAQLTAMSPSGLGRCLRCGDAALERLAALLDAGLAGSRRVPKVKRLLTLPAGRFEELKQKLLEARAARRAAGAVAAADDDALGGASVDGGSDRGGGAPGDEDSDDEDDSGLLWPPEGDLAARSRSVAALAAMPFVVDADAGGHGSNGGRASAGSSSSNGSSAAASLDAPMPLPVG
jgi:hypothetical protein